jgi:hypothetical protein
MEDFIVTELFELTFRLFMTAVSLGLATPYILVVSLFRKGSYGKNVRTSYGKVIDFWF